MQSGKGQNTRDMDMEFGVLVKGLELCLFSLCTLVDSDAIASSIRVGRMSYYYYTYKPFGVLPNEPYSHVLDLGT